jgi:PAS domain S-box-containing protein
VVVSNGLGSGWKKNPASNSFVALMLTARSNLWSYGSALLAVLAAIAFRSLLDPVLGDHLPYYLFYFAVLLAAIWGGIGPGMLALGIAFVGATYFFAYPRYTFDLTGSEDLLGAFRFISLGTVLVLLGNWGRANGLRWRSRLEANTRDLEHAQQEKQRTEELLASIGDGLITVDMQGKVTFMNQVAEQLCGWNAEAAKGKHVEQVFPIVHGVTREPVPNPALRALQEGAVAVLPQNVALLARDGVERMIDDSAAPIRDSRGTVTGSVLIFRDVTDRNRSDVSVKPRFAVGSLHMHTMDDRQRSLSAKELAGLMQACRLWIMREWQPSEKAVRLVSLLGFDLIVRQERTEAPSPKASAGEQGEKDPMIHFSVTYERPQR